MLKQLKLKGQKGFTLIELMIVVAIIGILAAIAIPNFLQYQMKSRQAEAKTNLGAIRTSEISFQAERSCYLGITAEGAVVAATKTVPLPWPGTAAVGSTQFCAGAAPIFVGTFRDIGFVSTGAVLYTYAAQANTAWAVPIAACVLGVNQASGAGSALQTGMVISAGSNLDGTVTAAGITGISVWAASNDNGAADCTVGEF